MPAKITPGSAGDHVEVVTVMRPVRSVTCRRAAVSGVALAVLLAAVPQAPAAAPWSAPEAIPGARLLWWESNALKQVDGPPRVHSRRRRVQGPPQ
jgi:hypothetical protein